MKIVYIFRSFANIAGTERILADKMNYFANKDGYDIYFITYEQGNHQPAYFLSNNIKWKDINVRFFPLYKLHPFVRIWKRYKMKKEFKKILQYKIQQINPDIIITTTYSFNELDIIVNLPGKAKKILESHVARKTMENKFQVKNKLGYFLASFINIQITKNLYKFSMIISLTHEDEESWKEFTDTEVIANTLTSYPPVISKNKENKRVISVGRLYEQKGFDTLINAWRIVHKKHPEWKLDIFGEGQDYHKLNKMINDYNLSDVVHINKYTNKIYDEYMNSDIYVLSSRWEGFGLVLIEAMSCGLPCVSFNCPYGPEDIIQDQKDGFLIKNGNATEMSEKICYLIEHNDARLKMGERARENVKRYLPEKIMPQWEKLFHELVNK